MLLLYRVVVVFLLFAVSQETIIPAQAAHNSDNSLNKTTRLIPRNYLKSIKQQPRDVQRAQALSISLSNKQDISKASRELIPSDTTKLTPLVYSGDYSFKAANGVQNTLNSRENLMIGKKRKETANGNVQANFTNKLLTNDIDDARATSRYVRLHNSHNAVMNSTRRQKSTTFLVKPNNNNNNNYIYSDDDNNRNYNKAKLHYEHKLSKQHMPVIRNKKFALDKRYRVMDPSSKSNKVHLFNHDSYVAPSEGKKTIHSVYNKHIPLSLASSYLHHSDYLRHQKLAKDGMKEDSSSQTLNLYTADGKSLRGKNKQIIGNLQPTSYIVADLLDNVPYTSKKQYDIPALYKHPSSDAKPVIQHNKGVIMSSPNLRGVYKANNRLVPLGVNFLQSWPGNKKPAGNEIQKLFHLLEECKQKFASIVNSLAVKKTQVGADTMQSFHYSLNRLMIEMSDKFRFKFPLLDKRFIHSLFSDPALLVMLWNAAEIAHMSLPIGKLLFKPIVKLAAQPNFEKEEKIWWRRKRIFDVLNGFGSSEFEPNLRSADFRLPKYNHAQATQYSFPWLGQILRNLGIKHPFVSAVHYPRPGFKQQLQQQTGINLLASDSNQSHALADNDSHTSIPQPHLIPMQHDDNVDGTYIQSNYIDDLKSSSDEQINYSTEVPIATESNNFEMTNGSETNEQTFDSHLHSHQEFEPTIDSNNLDAKDFEKLDGKEKEFVVSEFRKHLNEFEQTNKLIDQQRQLVESLKQEETNKGIENDPQNIQKKEFAIEQTVNIK